MVVIVPEWEPLGEQVAHAHIQKDNGRLYWNPVVHQYLGNPASVSLEYDDDLNWVSVLAGNDYAVVKDEDGNFYIDALDALENCGLEFPLANHIAVVPDPPENSHNRVIIPLE